MDLRTLPRTSNADLVHLARPRELTLAEFENLPVTDAERRTRNGIYELETLMMGREDCTDLECSIAAGMGPVERIAGGMYYRELTIFEDTIVVGIRHRVEHFVILTAGSCLCITERGTEEMKAPYSFVSPAGEKRVVMTRPGETVTWITVHSTTKTTTQEAFDDITLHEPKRKEQHDALRKRLKEISMNKECEVLI